MSSDTIEIKLRVSTRQITLKPSDTPEYIYAATETLVKYVNKGCSLIIFVFDNDTTDFHQYEFEYMQDSGMLPKKWLINNILYSITCKDTVRNMDINILSKLVAKLTNLDYFENL